MDDQTWQIIRDVADCSRDKIPSFDQLAEEVMELHLALRGRHKDTPAMEWLEIATIAANAFSKYTRDEQNHAYKAWKARHAAK